MRADDQPDDDKSPAWLKALFGLLGSLLLAYVGFLTKTHLQEKEVREAKVTLYTELMSKREESDTTIRGQMLSLVMQTFLKGKDGDLEQEVLGLELLAMNFHESIELSPLFRHVNKVIAEGDNSPATKSEYLQRTIVIAKNIIEKQLDSLQEPGFVRYAPVDFSDLNKPDPGDVFCFYFPLHSDDRLAPTPCEDATPAVTATQRRIEVQVLSRDLPHESLQLRLLSHIKGINKDDEEAVDVTPSVDFFDFPMVDNIHLSHSQRFAVSLMEFSPGSAYLALSYFPAAHASLRDKPYFDELMHDLLYPGAAERAEEQSH